MFAAPDAPTELVQLRQPESIRPFDEHHGRVRNVNPDFDHRGCDEDIDLAIAEGVHRRVFFGWA